MTWEFVRGQWKELKGMLLEEWGLLTHDEPAAIDGKRDQMIGRLQSLVAARREHVRAHVQDDVATWMDRLERTR